MMFRGVTMEMDRSGKMQRELGVESIGHAGGLKTTRG